MTTIETLANKRALSSKESFLKDLRAVGVLVRLDERGGNDEPSPWAFHGIPRAAVLPPRDDEQVDVQRLRQTLAAESEEATSPVNDASFDAFTDSAPDVDTQTAERPKMLPLPAARGAATVYLLSSELPEMVVGRVDTAEVCIHERSVTRRHAIVRQREGALSIVDLGGQNGTFVNQHTVTTEPFELRSGDEVTFGDVRCLYLSAAEFYAYLPRLGD